VDSHLTDDKLHHCLEAGMEDRLAKKCNAEKLENFVQFKDWLDEVKHMDEELHADRTEFEAIAKNSHKAGHCNNTFAEPFCCYNTSTPLPNLLPLPMSPCQN
jgi:hypothetical protein